MPSANRDPQDRKKLTHSCGRFTARAQRNRGQEVVTVDYNHLRGAYECHLSSPMSEGTLRTERTTLTICF